MTPATPLSTHSTTPLPIVVLISGRGSNLQAIINAQQAGLPIRITAVISNRSTAEGLEVARRAGIATEVIDHQRFDSREAFDAALQTAIDGYAPGLVVLAGYMRLLSDGFVQHYLGRLLNIHPSLLPAFKGLQTHQRALQAYQRGELTEHGASVHFVTPELDGGPVILQAVVTIRPEDTATSLAERVLEKEHEIYPQVIGWFAEGRLRWQDNQAWLDDTPLDKPQLQ